MAQLQYADALADGETETTSSKQIITVRIKIRFNMRFLLEEGWRKGWCADQGCANQELAYVKLQGMYSDVEWMSNCKVMRLTQETSHYHLVRDHKRCSKSTCPSGQSTEQQ